MYDDPSLYRRFRKKKEIIVYPTHNEFLYTLMVLLFISGVSMFTFPKHRFDSTYIIGAFVAILVGRFLNVYPLSAFLNIGRKNKIPGNIQVICHSV